MALYQADATAQGPAALEEYLALGERARHAWRLFSGEAPVRAAAEAARDRFDRDPEAIEEDVVEELEAALGLILDGPNE